MGCANANQMNCVLNASQERRGVRLKVSCLNSANIIALQLLTLTTVVRLLSGDLITIWL